MKQNGDCMKCSVAVFFGREEWDEIIVGAALGGTL